MIRVLLIRLTEANINRCRPNVVCHACPTLNHHCLNALCLVRRTQQTRDVEPMLIECWSIVFDSGPTFNQHWLNVSCLLGTVLRNMMDHVLQRSHVIRTCAPVSAAAPRPVFSNRCSDLRHVIGRDGHLDQSHACDLGQLLLENTASDFSGISTSAAQSAWDIIW